MRESFSRCAIDGMRLACAATLLAVVASGCTEYHRVPLAVAPCADACAAAKSSCVINCAESVGRVAILDGLRESLCDKHCDEDFDRCMLDCPGVR